MLTIDEIANKKEHSADVFGQVIHYGHEQVLFCNDSETGLKAIIAIHDTTLGPSLGGTRFWNYSSDEAALKDVLRLSRGMTYKSSISGIHLGGGKAVIIGKPEDLSNEYFWRRYGQFVNSLSGRYITAEDVGTSTRDMEYVSLETQFVAGKPEYMDGGGDPSPFTAYGVYLGMKASAKKAWGNDSLTGKKVLVEGVGNVGQYLVERLVKEGAIVTVTDINQKKVKHVVDTYGVKAVDPADAYDVDMDIYAPCALGATVNSENLSRLNCQVIAGAANNQLEDEILHGNLVRDRGIIYAPDFLINAGGVINCYVELGGYNRDRAWAASEMIYDRTLEIFKKAEAEDLTTHIAAIKLAEERIAQVGRLNSRKSM